MPAGGTPSLHDASCPLSASFRLLPRGVSADRLHVTLPTGFHTVAVDDHRHQF